MQDPQLVQFNIVLYCPTLTSRSYARRRVHLHQPLKRLLVRPFLFGINFSNIKLNIPRGFSMRQRFRTFQA